MFTSAWAPSARTWLREQAHKPRVWLVLLAFLLRLSWVLLVPSRPVGDFALYREAAEFLLDQGHLDSEFVYMPGYIILLAGVRALGGGLFAAKMVGVLAGTTVVFAAGGIADALFGRRAGIIATAAAAVWPAGVAVASVTGTDMPAAALGTLGVYALVSFGWRRPWLAAILCGLVFGLTAWVRAVAAPIAILSVFYWLAIGTRWPAAIARAALSLVIAFVVLLPWAVRNHAVYGEWLFTDSHGGNTALVGANPNSEGTYSRSLNLMFTKGTGYRLFEPPERHLQSDRAAYDLAKQWTAFDRSYAAGLILAKADRLLTHERNLLYWPVFRQGVLDQRHRAFFDAHRGALEAIADLFWWSLVASAAAGIAILVAQRRSAPLKFRIALAVLGFPVALAGIYTIFFAEVRYHLAIAPFLFPYGACALDWVRSGARTRFRDQGRTLLLAVTCVVLLFACWSAMMGFGDALRARYRWAVTVCAYPEASVTHLCAWQRELPLHGDSPVRGSWDGVGLRVGRFVADGVLASARTVIPVGSGRFRVRAVVTFPGDGTSSAAGLAVALRVDGRVIARAVSPAELANPAATANPAGATAASIAMVAPVPSVPILPIGGLVEHATNDALEIDAEIEPSSGIRSGADIGTVWVSQLTVERF